MIAAGWDEVSGLPSVQVAVFIPGLTLAAGLVKFVIDTGSVATTVHGFDTHWRLGIEPSSLDVRLWADLRMMSGIGGVMPYSEFDGSTVFITQTDGWKSWKGVSSSASGSLPRSTFHRCLGGTYCEDSSFTHSGDQSMTLNPL